MEKTSEKASTWLALRNPIFRRLWVAMVVSGSCIGAHNTAVFWALNSLGASTMIISLMATVSALPYTLFTLPAGAIADMVDRKKILLSVQLWHASLAIALAILQWKRVRVQSNLPLENFFESLTTAIRYVRYTPDQDSSGPARVILVLYLYYSLVDAGCRLEGITS
jgi:MFS family permease